jgi:predicted O-linked N-acetylglucosamine transferase (SPINDLY family)
MLSGDLRLAEKLYREAIGLGTENPDVYNNLAAICDQCGGKIEEAIELLARAVELAPRSDEIRTNLVRVLKRHMANCRTDGRYREALPFARLKADLVPESAADRRELGYCYAKTGQLTEAVKHFARAINLDPNNACYYNDLGLACFELQLLAEAQGAFQEVLRLQPNSGVAFTHLGLLANLAGLSGIAVSMLQRAVEADPKRAEAQNNMALFLRDQGELAACRHHYNEAMRLRPDDTDILSSYLLSLNDDPDADPAWVASEHRRYQSLVKGTVRPVCARDCDVERRLRVGYLSPDFRTHSVAYFIAPVLQHRPRTGAEITCYASGNIEDEMTAQVKATADVYRNVYGMSDEELACLIQKDGIDILVELSGHTNKNRLCMLANRVAPIQATYLGYPNTTGLAEMDYRMTDDIADPVGVTDAWHTEKLVRIAGGFLAYRPPSHGAALPVEPMPAEKTGRLTFGSFNNLAKINDLVLDTWAAILAEVPDCDLLLKARGLRSDKVQARISAALAARGVDSQRVRLLGHEHSAVAHLSLYNQMDLALDTFPYNGTTTTCEALWMGTPVVTLEGRSHAGRVGASLLQRTGLGELVAPDRETYIKTAVAVARDRDRLARLRLGLRERFAQSPVMDAARLAGEMEAAYRQMWRSYCASAGRTQ